MIVGDGFKKSIFLIKSIKSIIKNYLSRCRIFFFSLYFYFSFNVSFFFKRMLILRLHVKKLKFFELF